MGMSVGIFGGTFDPIHIAHLAVARCVLNELNLDKVLFVPSGDPYMREIIPKASAMDRMTMTALAVRNEPRFEVSAVDIDRKGPSYSIDTVRDLRSRMGEGTRFFLIIGADNLNQLPKWRNVDELLNEATLVSVGRPGESEPAEFSADHPGRRARYITGPMINVSGTILRERIAARLPLHGEISREATEYIVRKGIYH